MLDATPGPPAPMAPAGDTILRSRAKIVELRKRRLPQMVDWFDPQVLGLVAIRNLISATIGDYADQRPMQAATDDVGDAALATRHDYSKVYPGAPGTSMNEGRYTLQDGDFTKTLQFDADGGLWIDFISDLGDGFEPTYAMAYLMAQPSIPIEIKDGNGKHTLALPSGEILILGGDLAYPNATVTEYNERCIDPFDSAFQLPEGVAPKKKLFFIAGNHDWYDGLAAFTSVFCAARDRFARGKGKRIGGWQCEQRRSYFALALPHGWWFWGVDLALNETVDDAQKNYFELMSEQTKPGDRIIIVLHAPVWQTNDKSPLHEISQWARNRGAEVVAVLAGDLHHYSRYHSVTKGLELQLITAGGGGAFAHPTHQLPSKMEVHWSQPKTAALPHVNKTDYRDTVITTSAEADAPKIASFHLPQAHDFRAPNIYPTKARSMRLALRNLWLPLHNRRFAVFLGMIYMIFAWVFQIAITDPIDAQKRSELIGIEQQCIWYNPKPGPVRDSCIEKKRKGAAANAAAADANKGTPANHPVETRRRQELEQLVQLFKSDAAWFQQWKQLAGEGGYFQFAKDMVWATLAPTQLLFAMLANPLFFFMIVALYWGLIRYVDTDNRSRWTKWPVKLAVGIPHAFGHLTILLVTNALVYPFLSEAFSRSEVGGFLGTAWMVGGVTLYTFLMIVVGGVFGGLLFGLYWSLTSVLARMHLDSFSALGITGYKNFLRMRVDADKITIYPIGLDKVPGRRGWRALTAKDDASGHNPLIKPVKPLQPHLIEQPIVITGKPRTDKPIAAKPTGV